jgi:hypothetical protein
MHGSWITLYDVTRDGLGVIRWVFALLWIGGIIGAIVAIKKESAARLFLSFWLLFWLVAGGIGFGNVFFQYSANVRALRGGTCEQVEGFIASFHPQNIMQKGDSEHFAVSGHEFEYDYDNLGGGGLRSSKNFPLPLRDGLYVKVWYRRGVICRLDAAPNLSTSLAP